MSLIDEIPPPIVDIVYGTEFVLAPENPVPEPELIYAPSDLPQDPNDPVWPSEQDQGMVRDVGHETTVRGNHGGLDLLQKVAEEVDDWVERETTHGPAHHRTRGPDRGPALPTFAQCSKSWRGVTFAVDKMEKIVVARDDRSRVVITNNDVTNPVYLAHETTGSGTPLNAVPLRALASRELRTRGEVWCFPFVAGTAQSVDVQDEYGYPE